MKCFAGKIAYSKYLIRAIITLYPTDGFNYKAWHLITSFKDHAIQIYVGQKAMENQWRVMVLCVMYLDYVV